MVYMSIRQGQCIIFTDPETKQDRRGKYRGAQNGEALIVDGRGKWRTVPSGSIRVETADEKRNRRNRMAAINRTAITDLSAMKR